MARALLGASVLLVLLAGSASAHTCLTYPMMRGPHPDLYPGDNVCYQRTGNCGDLVKGPPTATFIQNVPTKVTFQQNLNHFWPPNPGHFDLSVSYDDEMTWKSLLPNGNISDFPANNMNTQTWFNVPVVFDTVAESAVVRVRYVSHNQNEVVPANNTDAIFYSCADVKVRKAGNWGNGVVARSAKSQSTVMDTPLMKDHQPLTNTHKAAKAAATAGTKMCKTPSRFFATGLEVDFNGETVMHHNISYDTVKGAITWVRTNVPIGGSYSMTDYWNLTLTSQGYTPQYIYGLNGPNTCDLYGGDTFFPWEYGSNVGMQFLGNTTDNALFDTMMFATLSSGFTWIAKVPKTNGQAEDYCVPYSMQRGSNMIFFDTNKVDSFPAGTFSLPAICTQHELPNAGCWAHRLKK